MSKIKLEPRYPNSRHEDITDAFVRGYEAGYNDSAAHYELEHCPACKNVADLQEALEENAKLRDENRLMRSMRDTWQENDAKLRELIADMWTSAMVKCDFAERCAFADEFIDRMRELEIEVTS